MKIPPPEPGKTYRRGRRISHAPQPERIPDRFAQEWADPLRWKLREFASGTPIAIHQANVDMIRNASAALVKNLCPEDGTNLKGGSCAACGFTYRKAARFEFACRFCRREFTRSRPMNPNTGRPDPAECPWCGALCGRRQTKKGRRTP